MRDCEQLLSNCVRKVRVTNLPCSVVYVDAASICFWQPLLFPYFPLCVCPHPCRHSHVMAPEAEALVCSFTSTAPAFIMRPSTSLMNACGL